MGEFGTRGTICQTNAGVGGCPAGAWQKVVCYRLTLLVEMGKSTTESLKFIYHEYRRSEFHLLCFRVVLAQDDPNAERSLTETP